MSRPIGDGQNCLDQRITFFLGQLQGGGGPPSEQLVAAGEGKNAELLTMCELCFECSLAVKECCWHNVPPTAPRSVQKPKFPGRADTEVIRYLITIDTPFSGHL